LQIICVQYVIFLAFHIRISSFRVCLSDEVFLECFIVTVTLSKELLGVGPEQETKIALKQGQSFKRNALRGNKVKVAQLAPKWATKRERTL
jgi:hypothetical protein